MATLRSIGVCVRVRVRVCVCVIRWVRWCWGWWSCPTLFPSISLRSLMWSGWEFPGGVGWRWVFAFMCVFSTDIMWSVTRNKHFNWKSWTSVPLCCWPPVSWLYVLPVHHSWSGRYHLGQKLHHEDCESIEYAYIHMQLDSVCMELHSSDVFL